MKLTPRYDAARPLIDLGGDPGAVLAPLARQRTRLATCLRTVDADEWSTPSRCDGWSILDVVAHLETVNGFWVYSIRSGLAGSPSRVLEGFDPAATPAQLVEAGAGRPHGEVLEAFLASNDALVELVGSIDGDGLLATAEAPPGHQSVSAVLHHALWDVWVHERDILEPLGLVQELEEDEVACSLRYAVALAPALAISIAGSRTGAFALRASDPDLLLTVTSGEQVRVRDGSDPAMPSLDGPAVELLEALSVRRALTAELPDDVRWMVEGLATAFDIDEP